MIEVYSRNVNVAENASVPFNNVALKKGCYEDLSGVSSLQFNHCGVYRLTIKGSVSGTGDIVLQVVKDGVVLPQTVTSITGTADADIPFVIDTFIQVTGNNGPRACQAATEVQLVNAGVEATLALVDATSEKVC